MYRGKIGARKNRIREEPLSKTKVYGLKFYFTASYETKKSMNQNLLNCDRLILTRRNETLLTHIETSHDTVCQRTSYLALPRMGIARIYDLYNKGDCIVR